MLRAAWLQPPLKPSFAERLWAVSSRVIRKDDRSYYTLAGRRFVTGAVGRRHGPKHRLPWKRESNSLTSADRRIKTQLSGEFHEGRWFVERGKTKHRSEISNRPDRRD